MKKNEGKIAYERNGVRNHFSQEQIDHFSMENRAWPECEGWVKVPQEKLDAELKASAQGGNKKGSEKDDEPTKAAELIEQINNAKTVDEVVALIAEDEKRSTVIKAKEAKIAELNAAAQVA